MKWGSLHRTAWIVCLPKHLQQEYTVKESIKGGKKRLFHNPVISLLSTLIESSSGLGNQRYHGSISLYIWVGTSGTMDLSPSISGWEMQWYHGSISLYIQMGNPLKTPAPLRAAQQPLALMDIITDNLLLLCRNTEDNQTEQPPDSECIIKGPTMVFQQPTWSPELTSKLGLIFHMEMHVTVHPSRGQQPRGPLCTGTGHLGRLSLENRAQPSPPQGHQCHTAQLGP